MSDILKKIEAEMKERILKTGESYNEHDVHCPYCAKEQEEVWEWGIEPNDEEEEVQCQKCDRHFMVSAQIRFSTRRLR